MLSAELLLSAEAKGKHYKKITIPVATLSKGASLRPLGCWIVGSNPYVRCQGDVTTSGRSFVQRSPNECIVSNGVWSWKLDNEETLAQQRFLRHGKKITQRQCTYKRNFEACSRNHCCRGKAISISYSQCVFAALGTQHGMCMRNIVICGLSDSTKLFHITS